MFYRLALEAGLDARLVAGYGYDPIDGSKEAHGWNIVKIGDVYYNLDSTWDAGYSPREYGYFLKSAGASTDTDPYYSFDETHIYSVYAEDGTELNPTLDLSKYKRSATDYQAEIPTTPTDISSWKAHMDSYVIYDGTAKEPTVTIPGLTAGTDFIVSYSNNVEIGTATVTIKGNEENGYTGTITKTFKIAKSLKACTATLSYSSTTYNGSAKTPTVTVVLPATGASEAETLVKGTDYTVAYKNNTNAGTATVTITGKGEYAGTSTKTFKINPASITGKTVTLSATSYAYNGTVRKPTVKSVSGVPASGYTVSYRNSAGTVVSPKYPGTYKVYVVGKGNYKGTLTKAYTIKAPAVAAQKSVSVNLYGHDDFLAKWSTQKVAGATVKYKVEYKRYGSKYKWTKLASGTTAASLKKANLADGARYAFRVTPYVTVNGKTYSGKVKTSSYVYALKKISTPKVTKKSKNYIKISWTNIPGESGYQIARSTKKSSGYKAIKTASYKYKTLNIKTTRNNTYYYKIRAYKTLNGKKIYGPWSSPRKYKLR